MLTPHSENVGACRVYIAYDLIAHQLNLRIDHFATAQACLRLARKLEAQTPARRQSLSLLRLRPELRGMLSGDRMDLKAGETKINELAVREM